MKHIFIVNPCAGKSNQTSRILAMAEALRQRHGLDCACLLTDQPGRGTELARRAAETGEAVRLYACGGDGTINEVANGVAGFDNAAMTCIPAGTGNDFLKNFGDDMPKFCDAENLWNGPQFPLDLIQCGNRYGVTIACCGIDARVAEDVHRYNANPFLGGRRSYLTAVAANVLLKPMAQRWLITLDGQELIGDYILAAICNGRYYGGGSMPVPQAKMDDGVLNTILIRKVSRLNFARLFRAYSNGQYPSFARLARVDTPKEISIHCAADPLTVCLDGECFQTHDVTMKLSEKRLNFFGPAGCDCNRTARA